VPRIDPWRVAVLVLLSSASASLAVGDDGRWYTQFRFGESMPFSRAHDAVGVTVGRNLTRHLGLEVAADFYEVFVDQPGVGKWRSAATGRSSRSSACATRSSTTDSWPTRSAAWAPR
jgi:hypothetical protein